LGILLIAVAWLISAAATPEAPLVDLPFFAPTSFIILSTFTLIAWYGWQLRSVDWPRTHPLKNDGAAIWSVKTSTDTPAGKPR
jgi:hypothetical protein